MKYQKNCLLICFILLASIQCIHAQTSSTWKEIRGNIVEHTDSTDLIVENAIIRLLSSRDSSAIKYTITDKNGIFVLPSVEKNNYILSISFLGYNTTYQKISPEKFPGNTINLGKIKLDENAVMLSEVIVLAEIPEVVVKQDTMEYNPAAFRMPESAVVEDLLKRLPGVEVDNDGKITVIGKEVTRIFVDGKEFFGNDPKMATKNLTLDIIDKVQVIDKKSDLELLTGVDDGEEETVINLTIKKGMKKGWISNTAIGAGAFVDNQVENDARYAGNAFVSRFLDDKQFTLLFNSNNVNNRGFTDGGNISRSGMRSGGSRGDGNGLSSSVTGGLNGMGIINDQWKLGGNIRYNYADELIKRKAFRQNFLKNDSTSYRNTLSNDQSYSNNIAFDGKVEFTPDTMNTFVLTTRLSFNDSYSNDYSFQNTLAGDIDSTLVNYSEANTILNTNGRVMNAELTYAHKFQKKGRRLNFTGEVNFNRNSGEGTNISTSRFRNRPINNRNLNQELFNNSNRDMYRFRASYIEPVWKTNNTLQFTYNIRYNPTENTRKTYDYDPFTESYSILNPIYSRSMENIFINQTLGASFNAVHDKYSYNVGVNVFPSYSQSKTFVKDYYGNGSDSLIYDFPKRSIVNYAPQLNFTYRFSKESNIRFSYRERIEQPSVTQLDPTENNTNPLNIRRGNPDLLPSFTHTGAFRYNLNKRESQRSLASNLAYTYTENDIVNYTSYEEDINGNGTGVQHTRPVNVSGSWSLFGDVLYNTPFGALKRLKFSTHTRGSFNNRIGFVRISRQAYQNISQTFSTSEVISLSYSKDWFYGQLRGNIRYSNTSNSIEDRENQISTNYGLTYNTQLFFPHDWTLSSDISYRANKGLSTGYNKNETVWNAEISKQFLSRKQASVRVKWTDILQQALSIDRNVNVNYIEDSEYNTLTSFFLVSFSYRFNQMGTKRTDRKINRENIEEYRKSSTMPSRSGTGNRSRQSSGNRR